MSNLYEALLRAIEDHPDDVCRVTYRKSGSSRTKLTFASPQEAMDYLKGVYDDRPQAGRLPRLEDVVILTSDGPVEP